MIFNTVGIQTYGTTLVPVPVISLTQFTYDGNEKSLVSGIDETLIEVTNGSKTNAGEYTAVFQLKDKTKMIWNDGTTEDKVVNWKINKIQGSISVSSNSIVLDGEHTSRTVTLTVVGDGAVNAVSSDDSCVDTSISGNTLTIYSVDNSGGDIIITITLADGINYSGDSVTINVDAQFTPFIYGVSWDGTSATSWTRTDAAANFSDPVPYVSGASNYSSPFDNIMPWRGMIISERTGGTMVAIPKFYYKLGYASGTSGLKIQITNKHIDGYSVSPAHMARGSQTNDRDVVYIGRYHCASDYKSKTGVKPIVSITRATARTNIHNLGSNIWQMDFAMRFTIWLLYLVEFANWNSQAKIGYGCSNDSAATNNMGYTNSMPYHTGTTQSSRTTYALGTQYRNIEGLWENVIDFIDGCYQDSSSRINIIMNPSNFSDTSNGTIIRTLSDGYPSVFTINNISGIFPIFLPTTSNGSTSTYSCDAWRNYTDRVIFWGGGNTHSGDGDNYGLFYISNGVVSATTTDIGCRLMELP